MGLEGPVSPRFLFGQQQEAVEGGTARPVTPTPQGACPVHVMRCMGEPWAPKLVPDDWRGQLGFQFWGGGEPGWGIQGVNLPTPTPSSRLSVSPTAPRNVAGKAGGGGCQLLSITGYLLCG